MTKFRLGKAVRHVSLGVTIRLIGAVESSGQLLLDWDGTGTVRWWGEPTEVAANENGRQRAVTWRMAGNMYDTNALRRLGRKALRASLSLEKVRLDARADGSPEHALQTAHLLAYAERRGVAPLSDQGTSAVTAANDR